MNDICIDYLRTIMRLKLEKFLAFGLKMDYCPEINETVIIYGAGLLGKLLLRCFDRLPICFIDRKQELRDICGVPVYGIDECTDILKDEITIIVTPVWDYEEIKINLLQYSLNVNIISLEKLVEKL